MVKYFQNKERGYQPGAHRKAPAWRDLRALNVFLMVGIVGLFAGYLAMNNQAAASGFAIKSMEKRIADLEEQRKRLDLEVLGRQSMGNVEERVKGLGFVPVKGVDYLTAVGGVVAVK